MKVHLYNFSQPDDEVFKRRIIDRITGIIEAESFIEGPYNLQFEKAFAHRQHAKHCLLVANGTDALEIALKASGIGPGDRVAVPSITFWATAEAVLNVGAEPVFVDVLEETGLIDPDSLGSAIDKYRLSAAIAVHIYGLPADMARIRALCKSKGVALIEDAAQAHGTTVDAKPVGHGPNPTTFSFYPTKNIGAFGDAGCILTDDDGFAQRVQALRNHGRGNDDLLGRNSRCDHIQAAVLDLKLRHAEELHQNRRRAASWYYEHLRGLPLRAVADSYLKTSSWYLFPVFFEEADTVEALQAFLTKKGIGSAPFYQKALPDEKPLSRYADDGSHNARLLAGRTLCLPMHPYLKREDIIYVCEKLKLFF